MQNDVRFRNKAIKWFVLSFIPVASIYWAWRVSKMLAKQEVKEDDARLHRGE